MPNRCKKCVHSKPNNAIPAIIRGYKPLGPYDAGTQMIANQLNVKLPAVYLPNFWDRFWYPIYNIK